MFVGIILVEGKSFRFLRVGLLKSCEYILKLLYKLEYNI